MGQGCVHGPDARGVSISTASASCTAALTTASSPPPNWFRRDREADPEHPDDWRRAVGGGQHGNGESAGRNIMARVARSRFEQSNTHTGLGTAGVARSRFKKSDNLTIEHPHWLVTTEQSNTHTHTHWLVTIELVGLGLGLVWAWRVTR